MTGLALVGAGPAGTVIRSATIGSTSHFNIGVFSSRRSLAWRSTD
jgi:hypothetical protein